LKVYLSLEANNEDSLKVTLLSLPEMMTAADLCDAIDYPLTPLSFIIKI
jgi:hypothetical protein